MTGTAPTNGGGEMRRPASGSTSEWVFRCGTRRVVSRRNSAMAGRWPTTGTACLNTGPRACVSGTRIRSQSGNARWVSRNRWKARAKRKRCVGARRVPDPGLWRRTLSRGASGAHRLRVRRPRRQIHSDTEANRNNAPIPGCGRGSDWIRGVERGTGALGCSTFWQVRLRALTRIRLASAQACEARGSLAVSTPSLRESVNYCARLRILHRRAWGHDSAGARARRTRNGGLAAARRTQAIVARCHPLPRRPGTAAQRVNRAAAAPPGRSAPSRRARCPASPVRSRA